MKQITLAVKGMTCSSCEVLIERKLCKVAGVEQVHVNRAKEEVRIKSAMDIPLGKLQEALQGTDYTIAYLPATNSNEMSLSSPSSSTFAVKRRHIEIGAAFLIIVGAYLLLRQFDILPKSLGVSDEMSYGFIFVIGLVAATSTCLAVAGGLLLAVAAKHNEKYPHLRGWQKFKPHLFFNGGRIASYTLLGGAIGLLGSAVSLPPKIAGLLTISASVLMVVIGIQLLGIFPWLNKFQLKMPKFFAHKLYDASAQQQYAASSKVSFLFGASTFFLPCGFTQALQLYVLGKGSFFVGALTMLAFSLGTLPSLAGIGAFSSFAKKNIQRHFMTFSAVLVIILGISNIVPGLNIMGASVGLPSTTDLSTLGSNTLLDDQQVIHMEVRGLDYFPAAFQLKKGIPVEWNIDGRGAQGCAQIISVPRLKITQQLSRSQITTISFTPQEEGRITFSCGMGMAGPGVFDVQA
ncbi:MAG: sulfite exporter TauE/SafE family protein [Nanoarchaeota archaeon]|nr:sulfite exporter TauE/SafE family protein [Nanoarchaeota archaeon]